MEAGNGSTTAQYPTSHTINTSSNVLNSTGEQEADWESVGNTDGFQRRRRSSSASPGSPRIKLGPISPTQAERERRRQTTRTKAGPSSPRSPPADSSPRQRAKTADSATANRSKMSPLAKRLGDDHDAILASQAYPGVVDFSMEGMQLGVSMDDILDPSAAPRRHGSTTGQQAGANIAPWLMDDSTVPSSPNESPAPSQGSSSTPFGQGSQSNNSSMPTLHRLQSDRSMKTTASRNGSQPSINVFSTPPLDSPELRSRQGSGDSIQTVAAAPQKPQKQAEHLPGGGRHSIAGSRNGRFGSTASSATSGNGEKKKGGFLGGLLKRKGTGGMSLGPLHDLNPLPEAHRASQSGSFTNRVSSSNSFGTMSQEASSPQGEGQRPHAFDHSRYFPSEMDGMISPLAEIPEPDFKLGLTEFALDMNLDDMTGIIDHSLATTDPTTNSTTTAPPTRNPTLASTALPDPSNGSSGSSGWGLHDALHGTVHRSEGSSSTTSSSQPSDSRDRPRESINPATNPFTKQNPFAARSSDGSDDVKSTSSASPQTYSPKHSVPPTNQPRRPSQLRNVKMGSVDSNVSASSSSQGRSLQPMWSTGTNHNPPTVFHDPFKPSMPTISTPPRNHNETMEPQDPMTTPQPNLADNGLLAPAIVGAGPAWAAPESWGVEGDEEEIHDGASSSSSVEGEEEWPVHGSPPSPEPGMERRLSLMIPSLDGRKPPPFGFKSKGFGGTSDRPGSSSRGQRTKTRDGRPSTSARTANSNRPGTSGSAQLAAVPHMIRIYRADGNYSIHTFPLLSTTADIISALSGANDAPPGAKRLTTTNKLYLRERGQDRMLLSSEKPLNIQSRRLQQAGFTEAEHIEELGKEDLATLSRFIYQTPALPVIDPEEESSYDSFEFIDIAGRDLQTIPIFLHLHAHNIIILNVSRNPMTDLPLDFIQACSSLKEIRMTNMALKRVPPSIRHSSTLSRLDISSNRIADLESVPLHEITTLLSLKVQNNKLSSIPSYFVQMKALKYLNISNNKFETFPAVVSEMSNLVDLDISFNNIAELPSEMSNLKSLERLLAYGNDLTTFPESFSTLANLRVLDVRRNKLTDLTSVYALPNLATLQADYNNLVTLDAQIGAKVRQFSVPHNSVTRFTLAPLPNMQAVTYALTHLNLSHGKISTLADEALSGLTNLVDLKLDFNQFTRLPSTLSKLVNLEVFSCTDNLIDTFPVGFGRMAKLHTVNCHNNNLREIPGDLWHCGSLRSTNFSSNLLDSLPMVPGEDGDSKGSNKNALPAAAYSVEKVYMGDNQLSSDVFHLLALLPNVKVINLSFNDIYEIPAYTINRLDKLEALYLSGNKLTSLPSEDLVRLQSLKTLHLNGNRLQTLPSELGAIKSLLHLDVGSNVLKYNIANWPYDWNWNWNTGLRYLNLSGNKRLEIKPTSAQDISHASSLRKELSDFTALTDLRVLGLMDVTLRIPSLPDESDTKRVRTSFSDINNMAYGISDMLGNDHLSMFDMVVPNFRGNDNECIFGMFGRPAPTQPSGKVARFLQETLASALSEQLEKLEDFESVTDAMRRSFLFSNRQAFDYLTSVAQERKRSAASAHSIDEMFKAWSPGPTSLFKTGASGAVVYLVDKTLYCANAGQALVVISRKGEAELLSKNHLSTDREETARIRRAEAWVSTKGYINDEKEMDISRAFGYWHQAPAVNASPEIRVRPLTETDEFVIIGNSALWACCSYQTAVDIARTERDDPMMAAQKLRDFAISYGAEGSVMVMVVNVSDLFHGRGGGNRARGVGSGPQIMPDLSNADDHNFMRAVRRRYEEVGDRTLNRLQQEIEPPQGQIAIVFTDIVNSTHLWDTNASMPTAIKMHHNLMRRQLRLDGGYEVKTEGDSFMVSFQTVTAAILWAFNCQIGLLREEWPRELLECPDGNVVHDSNGNIVERGLRVRMGIHWGAPQCERDPITRRMDYYGPMVNRAARINASADGGQLMASQDVIYEIELLRDYLDSLDDEGLTDLPAELKREVQEIRRVGIEIRDMGERKLKGLEVPEKLHLLYPKALVGRLEISNDIRANVEVNAQKFHSASRSIDIEQVKELSALVLRLEALSAAQHNPPAAPPSDPTSPKLGSARLAVTTSSQQVPQVSRPPSFLGPCIREDMTDEELTLIIESLTTRAENTMSTLYFKHLGGFSSVLAALEQATRTDPRLIVHALALMNGAL